MTDMLDADITQWLGRRPLAGGVSLLCTFSIVDRWPPCG